MRSLFLSLTLTGILLQGSGGQVEDKADPSSLVLGQVEDKADPSSLVLQDGKVSSLLLVR